MQFRLALRIFVAVWAGQASAADPPALLANVDTGVGAGQCIERGVVALRRCDRVSLTGQDGQLGRDLDPGTNDAADGRLGFSFAKICNSGAMAGEGGCLPGAALGDGANDWGCTLDRLTGMVWEMKTASGLHARDRTYTYYTPQYDPKKLYRKSTDASGFVDRVNAAGLCNAHDWSIAHVPKVQSILHFGATGSGARVDAAYFPNTLATAYWSSSLNPSSTTHGWTVHMGTGAVNNRTVRDTALPVRLSRSKGAFGPGTSVRYTILADGTEVAQTAPGATATWRRCVEGMAWTGSGCAGTPRWFTMEDALLHAAEVAAATGFAWRVPNVKELTWIVRREAYAPAVDTIEFPDTPVGVHCSATPDVRRPANAWFVDFEAGRVGSASRGTPCMLRLAR